MALLYSLLFFGKFRDKPANSLNKCILVKKKRKEGRREGRRKQSQQVVSLLEVTTTWGAQQSSWEAWVCAPFWVYTPLWSLLHSSVCTLFLDLSLLLGFAACSWVCTQFYKAPCVLLHNEVQFSKVLVCKSLCYLWHCEIQRESWT